jgi:septal ring factor EnvC (AmiA/AmiB activator)
MTRRGLRPAKLKTATAASDQSKAKIATLTDQLQAATATADKLKSGLGDATKQLQTTTAERDALKSQLAAVTADRDKGNTRIAALNGGNRK